jgi:predicted ArsR family transcriptional regulator
MNPNALLDERFPGRQEQMHALETSKLLTEEYSAKILLATMGRPKSAFELSEKLGIPIAACYRKIRSLESAGLLLCAERRLTQSGKRMSMYKAKVLNAQIVFEKNKIRARLEMIDGTTEDYDYNMDMSVFMQNAIPVAKM